VIQLTERFSVDYDGVCWTLTEAIPTKRQPAKIKPGESEEGERYISRYFQSLAGACKRAIDLSATGATSLAEALDLMRATVASIRAVVEPFEASIKESEIAARESEKAARKAEGRRR